MARKTGKLKDIKGHITPKDVSDIEEGTYKPRDTDKGPRPATSQEVRANNMVDVDTISKMVEGLANWVPMIESELDIMNSGKMGRPFEYCNSMIIWMMVISGYLDTTVRKISGLSNAIFSIIGIKGPSYNRFFERAMAIVGAVDDWLPGQ